MILVNGNTLYEKAAVDRMAVDCGIELKKFNVAMLSLYVGAVKTELIKSHFDDLKETEPLKSSDIDDSISKVVSKKFY